MAPMKSTSSTTNFNRTQKEDDLQSTTTESNISQAYSIQGVHPRERSRSKAEKRALTPKASKKRSIQPIDEKTEQDLEKELKAKREAAEKIKQRQEKFMQEIAAKREKEQAAAEEEKRKKEALKRAARE